MGQLTAGMHCGLEHSRLSGFERAHLLPPLGLEPFEFAHLLRRKRWPMALQREALASTRPASQALAELSRAYLTISELDEPREIEPAPASAATGCIKTKSVLEVLMHGVDGDELHAPIVGAPTVRTASAACGHWIRPQDSRKTRKSCILSSEVAARLQGK